MSKVKVIAIADGYYGNQIVKDGTQFDFKGPYKKDEEGEFTVLPLWVRKLGEKKEYVAPTPHNPLTADGNEGGDVILEKPSVSDVFGDSNESPSLTDLV